MKEKYESPLMKIVAIDEEDIIFASETEPTTCSSGYAECP